MANKEVKANNRANKGRTGSLTIKQRKRRGMKARPWGKHKIPAGIRPSNPPKTTRPADDDLLE